MTDFSDIFADLDTDLGDVEDVQPVDRSTGRAHVAGIFREVCGPCRGSGRWTGSYKSGECFKCKGRGFNEYKTDASTRAKAKAKRVESAAQAAERIRAAAAAWRETNKAEAAWLVKASENGFEFANAMRDALAQYGHLTEKQMVTVSRLTQQDAERAQQRAAERAAREASAPALDVSKIADAFATAKGNGVKRPKLRLADFIFSAAPDTGANAGAIYVKRGEDYLGKVAGGRFVRVFACDAVTEAQVLEAASNPSAAAEAYGQRTGSCCVCGRELTNAESVDRAIGPICAAKFGL